jgi:hypothetical protein
LNTKDLTHGEQNHDDRWNKHGYERNQNLVSCGHKFRVVEHITEEGTKKLGREIDKDYMWNINLIPKTNHDYTNKS